jgi:hypothetical protein
VLRYLPTNLSPAEIASELCVSVKTINTHIRNVYAKLGPRTAPGPCSARESYGCFRRAFRADRKITRSWRCRVTSHPEILASWTFQHYVLGTATVWRIGFGAMQLPGPGVFGPPRDAIQIRGYRDDVICRARPPGSAG